MKISICNVYFIPCFELVILFYYYYGHSDKVLLILQSVHNFVKNMLTQAKESVSAGLYCFLT